jgi:hypothetical protein
MASAFAILDLNSCSVMSRLLYPRFAFPLLKRFAHFLGISGQDYCTKGFTKNAED